MSQFVVAPICIGTVLTNCTVARSSKADSIVFIKTSDGEMFQASHNHAIDLLTDWRTGAWDRRCYAKLAGITVKSIEAAIKDARDKELRENKAAEFAKLQAQAKKIGYIIVRKL